MNTSDDQMKFEVCALGVHSQDSWPEVFVFVYYIVN